MKSPDHYNDKSMTYTIIFDPIPNARYTYTNPMQSQAKLNTSCNLHSHPTSILALAIPPPHLSKKAHLLSIQLSIPLLQLLLTSHLSQIRMKNRSLGLVIFRCGYAAGGGVGVVFVVHFVVRGCAVGGFFGDFVGEV